MSDAFVWWIAGSVLFVSCLSKGARLVVGVICMTIYMLMSLSHE